jgi:streptomycin 6-kinase
MPWWNGQGAAQVLVHEGKALLMERAQGNNSLMEFARSGRDEEASRIICGVVARLHAPRDSSPPELIPLTHWFEELEPAAKKHGGILTLCAATAQELLASPQEMVVLHSECSDRDRRLGAQAAAAMDSSLGRTIFGVASWRGRDI